MSNGFNNKCPRLPTYIRIAFYIWCYSFAYMPVSVAASHVNVNISDDFAILSKIDGTFPQFPRHVNHQKYPSTL